MFNIIRQGFNDGFRQPGDFNFGMSYDSAAHQWAYDLASHVGQWVGRAAPRKA